MVSQWQHPWLHYRSSRCPKEHAGTGKITVNGTDAGENAIEDVAATLAAVLNATSASKKVFSMQNGDTPINDAIASL